MSPLCGSPAETWSSTPNSEALQSPGGSPFLFREVLELSVSCVSNRGLPQALAGCEGCAGRSAWVESGTVTGGPQEVPAAVAWASQEDPRLCSSHGAEVPHSSLHPPPLLTHLPWVSITALKLCAKFVFGHSGGISSDTAGGPRLGKRMSTRLGWSVAEASCRGCHRVGSGSANLQGLPRGPACATNTPLSWYFGCSVSLPFGRSLRSTLNP